MFGRNKEYYISKGDSQYKDEQYKKAVESFSKAIKMDNTDYLLFHKRGLAYSGLDEHSNAISDYTTAIRIKPDFYKDYFNRSVQYSEIDKLDDAIKDISEYIRQKPNDPDGYFMKGNYYFALGDYKNAIIELSTSIGVLPNSDAYCLLGEIYFGREEYDNALSNLNLAYQIDSESDIICDLLGKTLYLLDRKEESEKYLKLAINLNSTDAETYFYMGIFCQRKREFKDAIQYYLKAISINDNDYVSYCSVGLCYCAIGEDENGIIHLEEALRLNPKDSEIEKYLKTARMPKCEDCLYCVNFANIKDYETKVKVKAMGIPNDLCICLIRWKRHNTGAWNSPFWEGGNPLAYLIRHSTIGLKQVSCSDFENIHTYKGVIYDSRDIIQIIIGNQNIIGDNNFQRF